ncbi:hypothetical protein EVAR_60264_1 [Eumeta japonica]|uniref:Uncharacterized protein n=1 Tax=Eumeta variegata TaxID=151549 RepID=A0A4C1Z2U4_EUMVA|nr:hypothetical protein EVAR_60264_1 [Eumeta japonica]
MLWSTWLKHENGWARSVNYPTVTEYGLEVTAFAVALRLVSENSGALFSLPPPRFPIFPAPGSPPLVVLFLHKRVWAVWPAVAVAFTCAHPICTVPVTEFGNFTKLHADSPNRVKTCARNWEVIRLQSAFEEINSALLEIVLWFAVDNILLDDKKTKLVDLSLFNTKLINANEEILNAVGPTPFLGLIIDAGYIGGNKRLDTKKGMRNDILRNAEDNSVAWKLEVEDGQLVAPGSIGCRR